MTRAAPAPALRLPKSLSFCPPPGHGRPDYRGQSLLLLFMLLAIAASFLAGWLSGILPARRAAAPEPVEALAAE